MSNILVFGGSFNPPHIGHVNVIQTATENFEDYQMVVLPSYQSPLKFFDYDPGIDHRLSMMELATQGLPVKVDTYEKEQGEKCFTIDVLPSLKEKYKAENIKVLIGLDQLYQFDKWKNYKAILTMADLVVTSRPGFAFPELDELPVNIKEMVLDYSENEYILSTGKKIEFMILTEDIDVSSSFLRTNLRKGKPLSSQIPDKVQDYITKENIYEKVDKKVADYQIFSIQCREILKEKNALGVLAYDVRNISQPSEFNLIASGTNTRHTSALAENLIKTIRKTHGLAPIAIEGLNEGRWVVIDYGSLIVHVFYDYVRNEYKLEELWSEGELLGDA